MPKKIQETVFVCANCGNEFNKWTGQCPGCHEWNTLKEMTNVKYPISNGGKKTNFGAGQKTEVVNLGKMGNGGSSIGMTFSSTIPEFDRVLGKGIVQGSVILFSGEPGIGKSTLLTQLIGRIGGLYAAGEESAEQIKLRAERLKVEAEKIDVLATNDVDSIIGYLNRTQNVYKLAVVDSIQVMSTQDLPAGAGSLGQIRECTFRLVEAAKRLGVTIIVVGHVTKEGEIAGPKLLEHMVDTVLYFEGERNGDLRILRTVKNRFGPTDEVGIFKMSDVGLSDVRNEDLNLTESKEARVGSAITILMEGSRPVATEIQALVVESFAPMPKRVFSGIDYNRGQLLVAVTQKVLGIPLYKYDVFIAVTGGVKIEETGADLAVVAAMWSSFKEKALKTLPPAPSLDRAGEKNFAPVFVGEVSLLGEVKKVRGMERRVKEAEGLGKKMMVMTAIGELKRMG